ncbi:hypothetical protein CU669_20415 [Paramagnetospirillum kuznetsovii]|uniref:Uncharacterized protein n=2 Tax=Paramagnetospirillum kuznetsovii TaxID=2053833 RepID=A0A364NSR8_9PROT|nr:hypothetical protein CU669_20415 [Paramagnetospirillum kuznetsovii]
MPDDAEFMAAQMVAHANGGRSTLTASTIRYAVRDAAIRAAAAFIPGDKIDPKSESLVTNYGRFSACHGDEATTMPKDYAGTINEQLFVIAKLGGIPSPRHVGRILQNLPS